MGFYRGPKFDESYLNNLKRALSDNGIFVRPDAKEIQNDMNKILQLNPTMLLTPTAGKTSKLYSQIPSSGVMDFTFTRNSSGSYADKNGNINIVSTNEPRFEFNATTKQFKGLLIEPSATNLLSRSQEFENSYWPKFNSTIQSDSTLAPDKTLTADKITITTNSPGLLLIRKTFPSGSIIQVGKTYTFSVYARADEPVTISMDINDSPVVSHILTTEWKRYSVTRVNTTQYEFGDFIDIATPANQLNKYLYFWGAQLEEGPAPTSYIPTTTNSASRSTDSAVSPLINYNTTEWTIFFDIEYLENYKANSGDVSGDPLVWYFRRQSASAVNFWNQNAQQNLGSYSFSPANSQKRFKAILSFNGSTVSTFVNGTKTGNAITPTNLTPYLNLFNSNANKLRFSKINLAGELDTQHTVKFAALWSRCLTDAESLNLTTI